MIKQIECELGGGLMVADREWFSTVKEELGYKLSIALDIEGRTEIIKDFHGRNWREVWRKECKKVVDKCNAKEMALLILHEGAFFVNIESIPCAIQGRDAIQYSIKISVKSEQIAIVEAESFLLSMFSGEEYKQYIDVAATKGDYIVQFTKREPVALGKRFVFGNEDEPVVGVNVFLAEPGYSVPVLEECPHFSFKRSV